MAVNHPSEMLPKERKRTRFMATIAIAIAVLLSCFTFTSHAQAATLDAQSGRWGRRYYTVYLTRQETINVANAASKSVGAAIVELKLIPLYLKQGATGTWGGLGSAASVVIAANVVGAAGFAIAAKVRGQCLIGYMSGWAFFVAPFIGWAYGPCTS